MVETRVSMMTNLPLDCISCIRRCIRPDKDSTESIFIGTSSVAADCQRGKEQKGPRHAALVLSPPCVAIVNLGQRVILF